MIVLIEADIEEEEGTEEEEEEEGGEDMSLAV